MSSSASSTKQSTNDGRNEDDGHHTNTEQVQDNDDDDDVDVLVEQVGKLDVSKQQDSLIDSMDAPPELKKVAKMIQGLKEKGKQRCILVLCGAGVSVSAGIPDFRTPGTGLYDNLQKYNLPYPEAVFDVQFYKRNPKPFCTLAKEIWPGFRHSPTLTHSFLKLLADEGLLLRNYSQNIDGLEYLAEIPTDDLVECHGHFRTASCVGCGKAADGTHVKDTIIRGEIPYCTKCKKHPVKPDIVFFGENLPARFHKLLRPDVQKAELLLVMGTSLQVAPVSLIPGMVACPRVLLNRELVMDLQGEDVFLEGDCDTNVHILCQLLGWEGRLAQQNKKTRIASKLPKHPEDHEQ